jgi:predicted dehydrogenase
VLIEKPLSTSLEGVAELAARAESNSRQIGIAYVYRSHPVLADMRDAIQSGRFGTPLNFVVTSGQNFPFYRPAYRETYYTRHETGGGAIQDAITHLMNASEWIVGPVTRLVADAEHLALPGVEVEDTVHIVTRHNRVLGSFSLNQHQAPNESSMTIVCAEGTARFEMHRCRWMSCTEPGADWNVEREMTLERDDLFVRQAALFLDMLEQGHAPTCPLEDATQTLKVNLAALQSVRERRWVEVNNV